MVEETLHTCAQYLTAACREESREHRAKTYHILVLQGKMRTAVMSITKQEMGGVLQNEELCTKTRERLMEVLRIKHPEVRPPTASSLDTYPDRPL